MTDVAKPKGLDSTDPDFLGDILNTQSNWLRQAKADLQRRDPVDAVNDAEALLAIAKLRLKHVLYPGLR